MVHAMELIIDLILMAGIFQCGIIIIIFYPIGSLFVVFSSLLMSPNTSDIICIFIIINCEFTIVIDVTSTTAFVTSGNVRSQYVCHLKRQHHLQRWLSSPLLLDFSLKKSSKSMFMNNGCMVIDVCSIKLCCISINSIYLVP